MSFNIKRVALWGGTGNLGPALASNIISSGFDLTILSRSASLPAGVPSSAEVAQVDVNDSTSLTSALKGHDALVVSVGPGALPLQPAVFDAAIAAGVKFLVPSEFGSNTANAKAAALPVFGHKITTQKYLEGKAKEGKVAYALVATGAFLDWGVEKGFLIKTDGTPTTVWNGGDVKFSATTLDDIGKAVAGVLKDPESFKNKFVYVNSVVTTENKLIEAARKAGAKIETQEKQTEDQYKESMEVLKSGKGDVGGAMIGFLMSAVFDADYGNVYEQEDSRKLGIKTLSDSEVDDLVAKIVKAK